MALQGLNPEDYPSIHKMAIPKGAADSAETIRAVILADGENVNQELIEQGYGSFREDLGGAEARAMHGALGIQIGRLAEGLGLFILPDTKTPRAGATDRGHS